MDAAAYDPALRAAGPQLGWLRARDRRFDLALLVAAWAVASLLHATVPDPAANLDLVMLYYLALLAGVLLLLLTFAAQDVPAADMAAARLEEWIRAML